MTNYDDLMRFYYCRWFLDYLTIAFPPRASERVDFNSWARNFQSDPEMPSPGSIA